ncbi:hypothetical protein JXB28_03520 [Candidatus Woesearchaeota archaeon]|nr:hypothetical protein [Candidatus Woesearchaeota archaeon]
MKGVKNYLAFITMLLLVASAAQAALIVNKVTDEFSVESPYPAASLKACQCSSRQDIIEVKNIGDFEALFKVEVYSPIKDLITLSDDTFDLKPGESQKVYVYIQIPCDNPLNSFYVASVQTNYGRSKEIYKEVVSSKCQNIKFTSQIMNQEINPGDIVTIKLDLQNVADFTDTFRIRPQAYHDFTVLSSEQVTLAPDEEKTVYFYVKLPLSQYGKVDYPFTITSDKGANTASGSESFIIEKNYDFSIKTEALELEACEDLAMESAITMTNLAKSANKYYLQLIGPGFVQLSREIVELEPGEIQAVNLIIKPTQKDVGQYEMVLKIRTEYGDAFKEKSFKLTVNDCFSSKAALEGQEEVIGEKACCGEKIFTLNLRNDGLYEEAYEIIADSPGWASVSQEHRFVRLKPSQNMNVPVNIKLPCVDEKQASFIVIKQLRAPYTTHEIRLDLESTSQRTCYNIDLLQDKYRINYQANSIPMLLKSTGIRGGTYKLKLGELESRFVELGQDTMSFEPGETKVLHIYPKDYQAYKEGTYLNRITLTLSLISDDQETSIDYHRQFWIVLKDKNFISKAIDYIRSFNYSRIGWCGVVSLILLGLSGVLLIIVIYMRFKPGLKMKRIKASCMKRIRVFNIILILLLILSILALILIGNPNTDKFYEEPTPDKTGLRHEWKQNTAYQINLAQYFQDPDMDDVLSYSASQPDHIDIRIEGDMAILRPEHNWAGEEPVVFTANDDKGGVTDSPVMALKVLKKQPVGVMGYWNTYCKHINLVLLIVLILLVLLLLDIVEEKGYTYYNPNKNRGKKG